MKTRVYCVVQFVAKHSISPPSFIKIIGCSCILIYIRVQYSYSYGKLSRDSRYIIYIVAWVSHGQFSPMPQLHIFYLFYLFLFFFRFLLCPYIEGFFAQPLRISPGIFFYFFYDYFPIYHIFWKKVFSDTFLSSFPPSVLQNVHP